MKKIAGVIKVLLIVLAALLLIHLLLRWKPLDQFLTSKIGSPVVGEETSDSLIRIDGFHDSLPETEKPYVYSKGDRLYTIYKGTNIDITPPGVSPVFFSEQSERGFCLDEIESLKG